VIHGVAASDEYYSYAGAYDDSAFRARAEREVGTSR
jgi:hypothetical protein